MGERDGESLGDAIEIELQTDEDDYIPPTRSGPGIVAMVVAPPSLAITALGLSLIDLLTIRPTTIIVELHEFSSNGSSVLHEVRLEAGVQLIVALVALCLALVAAMRLRAPLVWAGEESAAEPEPAAAWQHTVVGAALLTSCLVAVINAATLIYSLATHAPTGGPFS